MSSTNKLSQFSEELNRVENELAGIDAEIRKLRNKKTALLDRKTELERKICTRQQQSPDDSQKWETESFNWSKDVRRVMRDSFHLQEFRPHQLSAINIVLSGEDCLVIMSTGGGKSLLYQLPAVLNKGITLVVSPLISLIEDQIIQLKKLSIHAATLNQNSTKQEVKFIQDSLTSSTSSLRLLYVTPEKLAKSKLIMNKLEKCAELKLLKLIAVDEVHCCSQWGHDFRPDYQFLNVLKRQFKGVPILGLTATATANVLDDVKSILGIQAAITLKAGFNRDNLFYEVKAKPASNQLMVEELVNTITTEFPKQSGIIYCFSRKECEDLTKDLRSHGIKAAFYHAYVESEERREVHEKWLDGKCTVIVATLAFGMGIDKPDVRFVIHHSLAKSMEITTRKLADLFRQSTMVCNEKTGLSNLHSMLAYALRSNECRRVCIAEHFDEAWDSSWCNKMCDNCKNGCVQQDGKVDCAKQLLAIRQIMEDKQSQSEQGRITGNKLVELLQKTEKRISKTVLENIIGNLLLEGYLCEDFHFTPYNIISYISLTARTRQLTETSEVMLNVDEIVLKTSTTRKTAAESNEDKSKKAKKARVESISAKKKILKLFVYKLEDQLNKSEQNSVPK
uniref:ATP-dependent DNA helicase n=1 Tax=Ditylenchus dipsaci TaxID=166011 RepID=A0A915E390_9BILA